MSINHINVDSPDARPKSQANRRPAGYVSVGRNNGSHNNHRCNHRVSSYLGIFVGRESTEGIQRTLMHRKKMEKRIPQCVKT